MQAYDLVSMKAASIISCLFFGMIVGSPFFGWLSDYIKKRRSLMMLGSSFCFIFVACILWKSSWSVTHLHALFFLIGFTSSAQVLGYPIVTENNPPKMVGSSLSLAAIIVMGGGYGLALPFFGWMIDLGAKSHSLVHAFHNAFYVILIGIALSTVLAFFLRDKKE
jgi:MFS family permease